MNQEWPLFPLYLYLSRRVVVEGYREVMEEEGEWLNGMA